MKQQDKTFQAPRGGVPVGGTVDFPISTRFFTTPFPTSPASLSIAAVRPGTTRSVTFRRPGIVRVFCQISIR
jgi:hypothetical protein